MTAPVGRSQRLWGSAIIVAGALIVARNLVGLDSAPLGAYVDETSIGYNAWAIATHAVDEHGAHLPLYFTAFGEYKNPVYIYALSAVLRVLPLTVATERLPAAFFGLCVCLCVVLLAWWRSRSLPVSLLALCLAGLTPWLTLESRVGFEVISMLAAVSAALLCLARADGNGRARWYVAAGCLLGVAVFAYSTGRVAVALFAVALVLAQMWHGRARSRAWALTLLPVAAAYALLEAWNVAHPGALIARFNLISITADGAPPATVVGRFVGNYLTYFGPDFLFVQGDHNPRHATQLGGMLLWGMLPLVLAGVVAAWRQRERPYPRFVLLGTLAAPISAALTEESVPHALRAAVMLPFLLALAVEGATWLAPPAGEAVRGWRRAVVAVTAAGIAVQGALFTVDLYATWPARSSVAFDAGELDAIARAHALAGTGPLLLSTTLDQPYIQAAFLLRPVPPARFTVDSVTSLLAAMNIQLVSGTAPPERAGAIAVLSGADPPPPGAQRLFDEVTPAAPFSLLEQPPPRYLTVVVYRLR